MAVMLIADRDESNRIAAIDAAAAPVSAAAMQAMTAKYHAMGLDKTWWEDHG